MEPNKHHIVCIPGPAQGHINSTFKLAKLLHSRGFYITFVHTEFSYGRLVDSLGSDSPSLRSLDDFHYETILDGLPPDNKRAVNDLPDLGRALSGLVPKEAFKSLLLKLNASSNVPPISYVISDGHMNFSYEVTKELGIPVLLYYTTSACYLPVFLHHDELVQRGIFPLKDESYLTNGFLDAPADWIPGIRKGAKLKHLPTFIRTTDPNEVMFNYNIESVSHAVNSGTIILNTFDDLEGDVLQGIKTKIPNIYTIGPLPLLCQQSNLQHSGSNIWKEDTTCLDWLDKRSPKSVLYVNYGSFTILTSEQLEEFAWGLANSKQHFLWIIRNDLVDGDTGILSKEYMEEIKERGLISSWCPQERVLKHPSVGGFLTHCGWNSTMECISEGIPMICWPFFADQQTNCFYTCEDWGFGVEIGEGNVERGRIEEVVRDIMEGEKGKEIREKALKWKNKSEEATREGGSSYNNFEKLLKLLKETSN